MIDKPFAWEKVLVLIFIALLVLTQFAVFRNADISLSAIVTAILALLIAIAGRRHVSR